MKNFIVKLLFLIIFSTNSFTEENKEKSQISFAGVPALSYDSDSGFGYGIVGSIYFKEKDASDYHSSLSGQLLLTTKFLHSHYLMWDQKKAFNLPLRLISKIGFFSTNSQNYCGKSSDAACLEDNAKQKALSLGLDSASKGYEDFVHHYYQNRFMNLNAAINSQWLLLSSFADLSLMANYKGSYYYHGDFKEKGPYKNSLYATDFKNTKIDGYLSQLELGLMLDNRDLEEDPKQGFWLETSIRGASKYIGSDWDYAGFNAAGRFYLPVFSSRLTFASQTIFDAISGEVNFDILSKIGGSQAIHDYSSFGGKYIGRGIRSQLFVGKLKASEQIELRYNFYGFNLFNQHFELTAASFVDLGMSAWDIDRAKKDLKQLYAGFGPSIRIAWNKNFVIRADVGFSETEKYSPKLYFVVGNVF